MARKHRDEGTGDTWLNTYADMVTLLLTFFAVLLSMSSVNEEKFLAFMRSFNSTTPSPISDIAAMLGDSEFGDTVNGEPITEQNVMSQLYKKISDYVDENGQQNAVEVFQGDNNNVVYIRFSSAAFFEPDSYELRPVGKQVIDYVGDALKAYENDIRFINICGHTAYPPGASARGVWMLSGERAAAVATYFEDVKGIESSKMILLGYGKNYPISDNNTSLGMEKNRRVELVVVGNGSTLDTNVFSQYATLYDATEYPSQGGTLDVLEPPTSGDLAASGQTADNSVAPASAAASAPAAPQSTPPDTAQSTAPASAPANSAAVASAAAPGTG